MGSVLVGLGVVVLVALVVVKVDKVTGVRVGKIHSQITPSSHTGHLGKPFTLCICAATK